MRKMFLSMCWTRRFHIISTHCAIPTFTTSYSQSHLAWKGKKRRQWWRTWWDCRWRRGRTRPKRWLSCGRGRSVGQRRKWPEWPWRRSKSRRRRCWKQRFIEMQGSFPFGRKTKKKYLKTHGREVSTLSLILIFSWFIKNYTGENMDLLLSNLI